MGAGIAILALLLLLGGVALAAPGSADVWTAPAAGRRVLLVGDSLTKGYGPLVRLPGAMVVPLAVPGRGVRVLGELVPEALQRVRPTDVVVLLGVNDLTTPGRGVRVVCDGLGRIWSDVKRAGARLYAVALTPAAGHSRLDDTAIQALNGWMVAAQRYPGGPDVVVRTSGLGDADGRLRPEFDAGDHLHLTPAGYRALADLVTRALEVS